MPTRTRDDHPALRGHGSHRRKPLILLREKVERATRVEPATSSLGRDRRPGMARTTSDENRCATRVFAIASLPLNLCISPLLPPKMPEICQKSSTGISTEISQARWGAKHLSGPIRNGLQVSQEVGYKPPLNGSPRRLSNRFAHASQRPKRPLPGDRIVGPGFNRA